jgi:hypothetical protein
MFESQLSPFNPDPLEPPAEVSAGGRGMFVTTSSDPFAVLLIELSDVGVGEDVVLDPLIVF